MGGAGLWLAVRPPRRHARSKVGCAAGILLVLLSAAILAGPAVALDSPAQAVPRTQAWDPYRLLLAVASHELRRGRPDNAVRVLELVVAQRPGLLVARLILADSYLRLGRPREAKRHLEALVADPRASPLLAGAARTRLAAVRRLYFDWGWRVGVVTDTNPINFTDRRTIRIANQTLTVIPPKGFREVRGLEWAVWGRRAVSSDARWHVVGNVSMRDFPSGEVDGQVASAGVLWVMRKRPEVALAGMHESSWLARRRLYDYRYMELTVSSPPIARWMRFRWGVLDVRRLDYLDSRIFSIETGGGAQLAGWKWSLYAERGLARERPYSFHGLAASVAWRGNGQLHPFGGRPFVSVRVSGRRYGGADPIFGRRRVDRRFLLAAGVRLILGRRHGKNTFAVEVGAALERNRSSVDYFAYRKKVFQINLVSR